MLYAGNPFGGAMSEIQKYPFRVMVLAATISTLFASSSPSADIKTLRKQAEAGDVKAQFNIGSIHENGSGVRQDYAEAAKWYRKAAEQGDVDATRILGLAYYLGKWVPKVLVQSYFWFSLAASRATGDDYQQATEAKDRVAKELTPGKLKEAQRMVREWEKSHPRK
jgi:TPR repeat protein